ncbi:hypothetical protein AALO_G00038160 [Alosa alosa]|uniref:Uncharacterized protein n=1 Tax=Alosa alosa TaxID=278164 RepID=A0AAV6HC18_9TELE|nr:hypothetical protein AALO_G00038160 [Alosa alosa]
MFPRSYVPLELFKISAVVSKPICPRLDMSSISAASVTEPSAAIEGAEKKPLKPCCACPETKKERDACIIEKGEERLETVCIGWCAAWSRTRDIPLGFIYVPFEGRLLNRERLS